MTADPNHDYNKSDINRLMKALRHEEADRVPHLEFWVTSQEVYEYVLERELPYKIGDAALGDSSSCQRMTWSFLCVSAWTL